MCVAFFNSDDAWDCHLKYALYSWYTVNCFPGTEMDVLKGKIAAACGYLTRQRQRF